MVKLNNIIKTNLFEEWVEITNCVFINKQPLNSEQSSYKTVIMNYNMLKWIIQSSSISIRMNL